MKRKSLMRTGSIVLILFVMLSSVSFADQNVSDFVRVFRESRGDIIARVVNSTFYGMMIMYRGLSSKISQIFGGVLLGFMTMNALKTILQNIERMDIYSVFKMMLPNLVKDLIIAFTLVTPVNYSSKFLIGGISISNGMVKGTVLTQFTEVTYGMIYRLGTLFFNDSKFNNIPPGDLATLFISKPMTLLQEVLRDMSVFSLFTNMAKIVLLLFSLWACSKIIGIYISNIFTASMLTSFGIFYIIFLTMESTKQIGWKGIQIIVVQSVNLFLTVAFMGIAYQLMNLMVISNSIEGIAAMTVILYMLQQAMENISVMSISLTSGGGLGINHGTSFSNLSQALGMMLGGLTMWGGAKLDEIVNNSEEENKKKEDNKERIKAKARENVGSPLENEERGKEKQYTTGQFASFLFKGLSGDLSDIKVLTGYGKEFGNIFGNSENNPYNVMTNEERKKISLDLIRDGWKDLWYSLSEIKLSSEAGSMNEGLRISNQNTNKDFNNYERYRKSHEIKESNYNSNEMVNMEEYIRELEIKNRNNTNKIRISEEEVEEMIRNAIKEHRNSKGKYK